MSLKMQLKPLKKNWKTIKSNNQAKELMRSSQDKTRNNFSSTREKLINSRLPQHLWSCLSRITKFRNHKDWWDLSWDFQDIWMRIWSGKISCSIMLANWCKIWPDMMLNWLLCWNALDLIWILLLLSIWKSELPYILNSWHRKSTS